MVEVSNPGKVIFPVPGFTKEDLVGHYRRVAPQMLAHVGGRPLTLHRFPNGIGAAGFLQKNASAHFPESIRRAAVPKREGGVTTYPVVDEAGDLAYLANQGTVAFHVWTSRLPHLDRPDRVVFDLDPPEGEVEAAAAAALAVRAFLEDLGLRSAPMTTGSNGYHVIAPVAPEVHIDEVSMFARTASVLLAEQHPDLLTHEFRIEKRKGRVFVDWLRNRYGQTGVAAWSLRARDEAPVAVPFEWDELPQTPPRRWTLEIVEERLARPDPIVGLAGAPADLGPAAAAVAEQAAAAGIELAPFDRFRS